MTYDESGNVETVTPPGRPAHTFSYDHIDDMQTYDVPLVGTAPTRTTYWHDADRRLDLVTRPDGSEIDYTYTPFCGREHLN